MSQIILSLKKERIFYLLHFVTDLCKNMTRNIFVYNSNNFWTVSRTSIKIKKWLEQRLFLLFWDYLAVVLSFLTLQDDNNICNMHCLKIWTHLHSLRNVQKGLPFYLFLKLLQIYFIDFYNFIHTLLENIKFIDWLIGV